MLWEKSLFIDAALPFGIKSTPKVFIAMADVAEWITRQQGVTTILYY